MPLWRLFPTKIAGRSIEPPPRPEPPRNIPLRDVLEFMPGTCRGPDRRKSNNVSVDSPGCEDCALFISRVIESATQKDKAFRAAATSVLSRCAPPKRSLPSRLGLARPGRKGLTWADDSVASPSHGGGGGSGSDRPDTAPPTPCTAVLDGSGGPAAPSPLAVAAAPPPPPPRSSTPAATMRRCGCSGTCGGACRCKHKVGSKASISDTIAIVAPLPAGGGGTAGMTAAGGGGCTDRNCRLCFGRGRDAAAALALAAGEAAELRSSLAAFDDRHGTARGRRFLREGARDHAFVSGNLLDELKALQVHSCEQVEENEEYSRFFACPICLHAPMNGPHALRCGHCVCGRCLERMAAAGGAANRSHAATVAAAACPVCREKGAVATAMPLRHWDRVLRALYPKGGSGSEGAGGDGEAEVRPGRWPLSAVATGGKWLLPSFGGGGSGGSGSNETPTPSPRA
ncbi:unnamed protein product [Phaeothamnion confervicola]